MILISWENFKYRNHDEHSLYIYTKIILDLHVTKWGCPNYVTVHKKNKCIEITLNYTNILSLGNLHLKNIVAKTIYM